MARRRKHPDGLPFRVYERKGKTTYSIGYKSPDNRWLFRLKCNARDLATVHSTRTEAIQRASALPTPSPAVDTFETLVTAFFEWQESFEVGSARRRAESTLKENRSEAKNLVRSFGPMNIESIRPSHAYRYLDACEAAGRGPKGNKEISLARSIFEYAIRIDKLTSNPFSDIKKISTTPSTRLVEEAELAFVMEVARKVGGTALTVGLAMEVAYLCVRRSGEVRALTRSQLSAQGIRWVAGKAQRGKPPLKGLITWSPRLEAAIDEALTIQRHEGAPCEFIFGNLSGRQYTKGGWKKTLSNLMTECVRVAAERGQPFTKFNLQDCRPAGVTERLDNEEADVMNATLHKSPQILFRHYDRRRTRVAKATK